MFFEDAGAVVDLATAQRFERRGARRDDDRRALAPDAHERATAKALRRALPGTQIIGTADEATRIGANGELVRQDGRRSSRRSRSSSAAWA